jgi:hypothetical protein
MNNSTNYIRWLIRKWLSLLLIVVSILISAMLIQVRAGWGVVIETLLLTLSTSLLVSLIFELTAKNEFLNLLTERLQVQENFKEVSIEKIFLKGNSALEEIRTMLTLSETQQVDLLSVSGGNTYSYLEEDIVNALKRGRKIRVLLCREDSAFVKDKEDQENRPGQIKNAIDASLKGMFHKMVVDIFKSSGSAKGELEVKTHNCCIYSNMAIARNNKGKVLKVLHVPYLTPTTFPTTTHFATSFLYKNTEQSSEQVEKLALGFDTLWTLAERRLVHNFKKRQHDCNIVVNCTHKK